MKKIAYFLILILFLVFPVDYILAADCSGQLINTSYNNINAPANDVYGVGDIVNTNLSFELKGGEERTVSPLSIVFVIDISGSMGEMMGNKTKLEVAKEALAGTFNGVVDGITDGIHNLNTPDIKISLVSFDSFVNLEWYPLSPIDSDAEFESLERAIYRLNQGGGTRMGAGVHTALGIFNGDPNPDSKKVIIVASDGISEDRVSFSDKQILANDVTGYAIGIGNYYDRNQLLDVTDQDLSRFFDVNNANQLNSSLEDIMEEVITFQASDLKASFSITELANSNLSLINTNPNYSSISPDGKVLTWEFGNKADGYVQNINLDFRVNSAITEELPLNEDFLNFSYNIVDENGAALTCSSREGGLIQPSIPVVNIFTHEIPTINFWSSPASGSSIYQGNSLVLSWRTQNADKCISSSSDRIAEWNSEEIAAELADANKTVYPSYTGNTWNIYNLQCQKTYDFGEGVTKTVYSNREQVQIRVNPCMPTHTCLLESVEDACASMPCGSSVTLNATCSLVNDCGGAYSSCSDAGFSCSDEPATCPDCKEVDEWIEVAP